MGRADVDVWHAGLYVCVSQEPLFVLVPDRGCIHAVHSPVFRHFGFVRLLEYDEIFAWHPQVHYQLFNVAAFLFRHVLAHAWSWMFRAGPW